MAPVRACACPVGPRDSHTPPAAPRPAEPATTACHGCCPPGAVQATCCCQNQPTPKSASEGLPGCQCARCECDGPTTPPVAPAPGGEPDPAQFVPVADAALVPPAFLPLPTADRPESTLPAGPHPPDDLVITLSRLTC